MTEEKKSEVGTDRSFADIVYEWRVNYITQKPKTKLEPDVQRDIAKRVQDELRQIRIRRGL